MRCFALIIALSAMLAACASIPPAEKSGICPILRGDISFCLLEPAQLPQGKARHMVYLQHNNASKTFIGILTINDHHLKLHGLSPMGLQLFSLQYDGQAINVNAPEKMLPKPALLIALLQLMLAETGSLNKQLSGDATITQNTDGTQRLLRSGNNKIIIINRRGTQPLTSGYSVSVPAIEMQLELRTL